MSATAFTRPVVLAAAVALANAAKPAAVDDTAYLAFARHLAAQPFDPYGFDIYWYDAPEPAMGVLLPPVLPYWLALGMRLFGEHVFLLKLWLFPFLWLLAWSLDGLLKRFARGTERLSLPLLMLSPAILPTVNLMLDVPALALGLAAVRVFVGATKPTRCKGRVFVWHHFTTAGLLTALAMQTKYTMLLTPAVIGWYGLMHRAIVPAILSIAVAFVAFAGWEAVLWAKYGDSHFLLHAAAQSSESGRWLDNKLALFAPMAAHLGCLAFGFALFAGRAVGVPQRGLLALAGLFVVGVGLVAALPLQDAILVPGKNGGAAKLALAALVWRCAGAAVLIAAAACAALLLVRWNPTIAVRRNADSIFVVGWVLLEIAGYFALTPFPAARRVLGISIAMGVLAARVVSRANRARPDRRLPRWIVPFGIAFGVLVAALDTFDAYPEKEIANRAAAVAAKRERGSTVWFSGHWGFQHYCERAGMRPVVFERTAIEAGDTLVLPVFPERVGFYRPNNYHVPPPPPPWVAEPIAEFAWDDPLSAQTIPPFYGGNDPIAGRDGPRLRVVVFRFTQPWLVGDYGPPVSRNWR